MNKYYQDTLSQGNINNIISLNEYKAKLFNENPEIENLIDWDFLKSGSCYSNAFFLCDYNDTLNEDIGETLFYCEGLVICRFSLRTETPEAVHHSWIYSTLFECYVDCTPNDNPYTQPNFCNYYISDTLSGEELDDFIESFYDEDECTYNPTFIHPDVPLGLKVPKSIFCRE